MKVIKLSLIAILTSFSIFMSSIYLVNQVYEHRTAFTKMEKLQLEKVNLTSQSDYLFEEIEYLRNQNTINKVARKGMKMISPKRSEVVFLIQGYENE